ncbi:septation protein SepH [Jatrophihabitans sp.]|uniref:septation protein SepH n=1 Tax=Jatrophihabitans sp. TaxID=1932789 RepID=UPI0030C7255F
MRELRFVSLSEDSGHVVVESHPSIEDAGERFLLPISDELRAALTRDEPAAGAAHVPAHAVESPRRPSPNPPAEAPAAPAATGSSDPSVSPREIQMRVRSGEAPEQLAEEFNASLDWLMRFAGPVLAERSRMADEARRARARRSTSDAQTVIFGETVDERFAAHGIDPTLVRWDTHRREDGQWVVSAHWLGGESERVAEWAFNLAARSVAPIDDTASDLLSDRPIRPVTPEFTPMRLTVAPPLTAGVVAFPAMPNAHTGPLPTREQLFDQQMFEDAARHPSAQSTPPQQPAAVPQYDSPPLPLGIVEQQPESDEPDYVQPGYTDFDLEGDADLEIDAEPELFAPELADPPEAQETPAPRAPQVTNLGIAHRDGEAEEEKAARAHIPSWDDILLGVRRKND